MNNSKLDKQIKTYLLNALASEDYEGAKLRTPGEQLAFFNSCFESEYGHMIERVGRQKALTEYLQGLPSAINLEFMNHKILELAEEWGQLQGFDKTPQQLERREDFLLEGYWPLMAVKLSQLIRKYQVAPTANTNTNTDTSEG